MENAAQLRKRVRLVVIVMVLGALVLSIGIAWCTADWGGMWLNWLTELGGAAVTYYLFDQVIGHMVKLEEERETEKKEREARKAKLIAQMGSRVPGEAIRATEELRRHGWHRDGSLQRAFLPGANLPGASLFNADLQRAHLAEASLQGANLAGASLQGAFLFRANLQKANLSRANLQEAHLQEADLLCANLQGANLAGASLQRTRLGGVNLQEAHLSEADLQEAYLGGADLQGAFLSEDTTLPDGTKWTPDTDMARFTDPDHPDFWRPDVQQ